MKTDYRKLWKLLIDKKMTKGDLRKQAGISSVTLAKLGKGENVTTDVLLKICAALECGIADIMEIEQVIMKYFLKRCGSQELGSVDASGKPQRGRYLLISMNPDILSFFPPLSTVQLNDFVPIACKLLFGNERKEVTYNAKRYYK